MQVRFNKKAIGIIFLILFCMPFFVFSSDSTNVLKQVICGDCHLCPTPTIKNPCLKNCLRHKDKYDSVHSPSEGPDIAVLDQIVDIYQAVKFNHKLHADMVGMGEGCETCHHYSPPGVFPPCIECHSNHPLDPTHLRQPGLKGAYHRQCMGCHREWSHDTKCIICHLPSEDKLMSQIHHDSTDIIGIDHPVINVPYLKVYQTPYEKGPIVTFHHQEHIDLFGLRCVDCHQKENCSYCHDLQKNEKLAKTDEEIHAICNDCHKTDKCANCHDTKQKPAFAHSEANWNLSKYHLELECRNCHPTGKQITTMNGDCINCHAGWNFDNFRHEVTGLRIDEIHGEFDCESCHIDLHYHQKPDCSSCHDDNRDYKTNAPGEYIKL